MAAILETLFHLIVIGIVGVVGFFVFMTVIAWGMEQGSTKNHPIAGWSMRVTRAFRKCKNKAQRQAFIDSHPNKQQKIYP